MNSLSFASFNTHFGRTRRGQPYDIADVCKRLDVDVIALQEVFTPTDGMSEAADAARSGGYEVHELRLAPAHVTTRVKIARSREAPETEGMWGLALLVRVPARRLPDIRLGQAMADPAPRAALVIEATVGDQPVVVATAHASHRPYGSLMQLRRLEQALSTGVDSPAVLAGDMNMWGPIVSGCFPDWRRAVLGPTWPAHRPHSQIDHILVRGPIELVGGRVCDEEGSDHRPIRVDLRIH